MRGGGQVGEAKTRVMYECSKFVPRGCSKRSQEGFARDKPSGGESERKLKTRVTARDLPISYRSVPARPRGRGGGGDGGGEEGRDGGRREGSGGEGGKSF